MDVIRNPADIIKASGAFGVFSLALTVSGFGFSHYFFDYQRLTLVFRDIFFDINFGVLKTVAYKIFHSLKFL